MLVHMQAMASTLIWADTLRPSDGRCAQLQAMNAQVRKRHSSQRRTDTHGPCSLDASAISAGARDVRARAHAALRRAGAAIRRWQRLLAAGDAPAHGRVLACGAAVPALLAAAFALRQEQRACCTSPSATLNVLIKILQVVQQVGCVVLLGSEFAARPYDNMLPGPSHLYALRPPVSHVSNFVSPQHPDLQHTLIDTAIYWCVHHDSSCGCGDPKMRFLRRPAWACGRRGAAGATCRPARQRCP